MGTLLTPTLPLLLGLQEADAPDLYLVHAGRPRGGPGGEGGRQHSNDLDISDQGAAEDYMASRMTGLSVGRGPAAASAAQGGLGWDGRQCMAAAAAVVVAARSGPACWYAQLQSYHHALQVPPACTACRAGCPLVCSGL
jgi:hypothetical protein